MAMGAPILMFAWLVTGAAASATPAQFVGEHRALAEARRQGQILPLREIERRVVPQMRGAQYLGFDFDPAGAVYTLKFLRDGAVIWVDVDGRTGRVTGRSR